MVPYKVKISLVSYPTFFLESSAMITYPLPMLAAPGANTLFEPLAMDLNEVQLDIPIIPMTAFEGTVLENTPEALPSDQRITPFVTDVNSSNIVTMGFSEPLATSE